MSFYCIKRWSGFCVRLLAGMLAVSLRAQAGQPIIYSSGESGDVSSNMMQLQQQLNPALSPQTSGDKSHSIFESAPPANAPHLPPPIRVNNRNDRDKDWMLMTPAEILQVPTPESYFGVSERDAFGNRKTSTPMERFLERQNASLNATPTNASDNKSIFSRDSFRENFSQDQGFKSLSHDDSVPTALNKFFNSLSGNDSSADKNDSQWDNLRAFSPPQPTAQTKQAFVDPLAPLPGMSAQPAASAPAYQPAYVNSPNAPDSLFDPNRQVRSSLSPLNGKLGALPSLPSLPGGNNNEMNVPKAAPSWAPKPPPWASSEAAPMFAPQKRF